MSAVDLGRNKELETFLKQRWESAFGSTFQLCVTQELCSLEDLSEGERQILEQLPKARQEPWRRGRRALKPILQKLGRDDDTSSLFWPQLSLSLSHCGSWAIAVGSSDPIKGLGVDLEKFRAVPEQARKFFLSAEEAAQVRTDEDALRLWTVKESLYKADSNNQDRLLFHYLTGNPNDKQGHARLGDLSEPFHWKYDSIRLEYGFITLALLG